MSLAQEVEPKTFGEMAGNPAILLRLSQMKAFEDVPPAMIFDGPPAVGKTTSAKCLAGQLKPDVPVKLVGASIYRKTEELARTLNWVKQPFSKIVFFDEIDSMDMRAQRTLVELVAQHSHQCRFIFACNTIKHVEARLRSASAYFRYQVVAPIEMAAYLERVAKKHGYHHDDLDYIQIATSVGGDMRKAVDALRTGVTHQDSVVSTFLKAARTNQPTAHMRLTKKHVEQAARQMSTKELAQFTMWFANRERRPLMF